MSYAIERDWVTAAGLRAVVLLIDLTEGRSPQGGFGPASSPPSIELTHRCGYVMVDREHGLWGMSYQDVDDVLAAHGGLTYSSVSAGEDYPAPSDDGWWVGFDCAHGGDSIARWTGEGVAAECEGLARMVEDEGDGLLNRAVARRLREL